MTIEVVTIVLSAVVTFLFGEKLYTWIFVREDKASKQVANFAKVAEAFQTSIEALQQQLERSNQDSREKQEVIVQQQKELFEVRKEKSQIEIDLAIHKVKRCDVKGCAQRTPPTGY